MEDEADLTGATARRRPKPDVLEIGGRKLNPATLMMGHGFDPALSEGSLKPPIFLTSTFVFESASAGKRFFEGVTGKRPGGAEGLIYSRFNGPNQEILEDRLSVWEDAEDALSFSSGMSAIATLLLTFVQPGDVIVHSGPLYAATETLIGRILGKFGVQWLDFPAGAERSEIEEVIERARALGRVSLIYLESPANRPTRWSTCRQSPPPATRSLQMRTPSRRSPSTTPSSARSGRSRFSTAPISPSIR
jgi:methionine-gamma-lyase